MGIRNSLGLVLAVATVACHAEQLRPVDDIAPPGAAAAVATDGPTMTATQPDSVSAAKPAVPAPPVVAVTPPKPAPAAKPEKRLMLAASSGAPASAKPATKPAATPAASGAPGPSPSAEEIMRNCDYKYAGEDNRSQLSIKLLDRAGNERTTVYLRLWKAFKGEDDLVDKMLLFTFYPPDAEGAAFMRWAYSAASHRNAEQWIYLPVMRNIRRVSVRDLADSFLGSDLTYGDITERRVEDDNHTFVQVDTDPAGQQFWVVQSVPKEADSIYGKKVQWFTKTNEWAECVKARVDYYDKRGLPLKRQDLKWQRIDNAWAWDKVTVKNVQTFHSSEFQVKKVVFNIGINDESFSERRMQLGVRGNER